MLVFSERSCCHSFPMYGGELWWQCAVLKGPAQICCETLFVDPLINCDSEVVNFIYSFIFVFYFTWMDTVVMCFVYKSLIKFSFLK